MVLSCRLYFWMNSDYFICNIVLHWVLFYIHKCTSTYYFYSFMSYTYLCCIVGGAWDLSLSLPHYSYCAYDNKTFESFHLEMLKQTLSRQILIRMSSKLSIELGAVFSCCRYFAHPSSNWNLKINKRILVANVGGSHIPVCYHPSCPSPPQKHTQSRSETHTVTNDPTQAESCAHAHTHTAN